MAMRNREDDGMITKVVSINRVSKTVKGRRIMTLAALVVVGDGKGTIGYGIGKSGEVPEAIRKGEGAAKKNMRKVCLKGTTIPHEIVGEFSSGKTSLVYKTIAANQALDPNFFVVWVASEPFVAQWAEAAGCDLSRFEVIDENVIEIAFPAVLEFVGKKSGPF